MNSRPQEPAQEPELSSINSLPSSLLHAVFSSLGPKGTHSGNSEVEPAGTYYLRIALASADAVSYFDKMPLHVGCCATDLCNVSATCTCWSRLTRDKASNNTWKKFYTSRWRVTGAAGEDVCWQSKYGSKMKQVRMCIVLLSTLAMR